MQKYQRLFTDWKIEIFLELRLCERNFSFVEDKEMQLSAEFYELINGKKSIINLLIFKVQTGQKFIWNWLI